MRIVAAVPLSLMTWTTVYAGGVVNLSCLGGGQSLNCVAQWATGGDPYLRAVPEPIGDAQKAQASARERKWLARCHPIVEHDSFGVSRYYYSAPGCEYGIGTD